MKTIDPLCMLMIYWTTAFAYSIPTLSVRDIGFDGAKQIWSNSDQVRPVDLHRSKARLERRGVSYSRKRAQRSGDQPRGSTSTSTSPHGQTSTERNSFQPMTDAVQRNSQKQYNKKPEGIADQLPLRPTHGRTRQTAIPQAAAGPYQPLTRGAQRTRPSLPLSYGSGTHSSDSSLGPALGHEHDNARSLETRPAPSTVRLQSRPQSAPGSESVRWSNTWPRQGEDSDSSGGGISRWLQQHNGGQPSSSSSSLSSSPKRLAFSPNRNLDSQSRPVTPGVSGGDSSSSVTSISTDELTPLMAHSR